MQTKPGHVAVHGTTGQKTMAKGSKTGGSKPGTNARAEKGLKTRVRSAKGRKISSTLWLQRQLNDPYIAKAKAEGYRSRAAFKLSEMNDKHKFLKPGMRVVDLGCAPGGWLQVAVKAVKSTPGNPTIVGIDYLGMGPVPGTIILEKDFTDEDAPKMLIDALGGHKVDVVLSDMASPTTGHRPTDHLRIIALVEMASEFAIDVLKPGGILVAKVFQGGTEHQLLAELKRHFTSTFHAKPPASRSGSAESYLIAKGFKG